MSNIIKDAVQPEAWYKALPRTQYKKFEKLASPDSWFSIYKILPNIFAIYEPRHFQEVISYLVIGKDSSLLIDTGMGFGNIKKVVDSLCSNKLQVVNTHSHFDHTGGNYQFPLVHIFDDPYAVNRLKYGLSHDMVKDNLVGDSTILPYPSGFNPDTYCIKPSSFKTINEGFIFKLGDRQFEVMHTPGHSSDSIMLFDKENKIVFTGDTFYPATLYAHLDSPDGLKSVFETYRETMHRVASKFSDYTVIASHNEPLRPGTLLKEVADAFDSIANKTTEYNTDEHGLKKYTFNGFSIVTK